MLRLYDLTKEFGQLLELYMCDDLEPEEKDKVGTMLSEVQINRDDKLSNCVGLYKNLEGDLEKFEATIEQLKKKAAAIEKRMESVKQYTAMCCFEGEKWKEGVHSIGWKPSVKLEILDESRVPDEWKVKETIEVVKVPKDPIKKWIMDAPPGEKREVPGTQFIKAMNIQIK